MVAILLLLLVVLFMMAMSGLFVAASGSVFLHLGFWDCWHAAWDRPGLLLLFAIIMSIVYVSGED